MSLPEVSGKELVGSVDIVLGEAECSHESTNGGLEDFLECARLGNLEEFVDSSLDVLDEINLPDGRSDRGSNGSSLVDKLVEDRCGDLDYLTTNLLEGLTSSGSSGLHRIERSSYSSSDASGNGSSSTANASGDRSEPSLDSNLGHGGVVEKLIDFTLLNVDGLFKFIKVLLVLLERNHVLFFGLLKFSNSKVILLDKRFGLELEVILGHVVQRGGHGDLGVEGKSDSGSS